ncbi:hypothetical protein CBR_g8753 [Chara braunii]|uniref:Uncharacterized protein n=1 Tax=Chara braunii TaxID=69332 RepID=A0A388KMR8_CHABU|nr:hypothetical protein CBR_g8753 [Chara braunii]|eukprot:GBG71331.1 hypothetical protein CBR_g8753 [Chara braunii]
MSKLYNDKPWALDWVGGHHTSGYGTVVFLSDDNNGSWYCCGGVEKSEAGWVNYDDRKFRTFFLTSIYDNEGKNRVKEDKKASLHLHLFQGYGVKAFLMKAFDVHGNDTEFRMLDPQKFLSKTNGCRVTGSLPIVDSAFLLSGPLVQFNSPTDQLGGVVMQYREQFTKLPIAEQVDCDFKPTNVGPKRRQDPPATPGAKRKQLSTRPSLSNAFAQVLSAPSRPRIGKVRMRPSSPARAQTTTTELCAAGLVPNIVGGWCGGGGRQGSQRVRPHELRDSGNEGEGVGSRMPEGDHDPVQHATPLDTTHCFFLEYDEDGFARQHVNVVNVDVTRIKRIPCGKILYNHRSLSENIVRGIENVIENSITADPGTWDRSELVLAPVDPNDIVGRQGRRITLDEFCQRDSAEFNWYTVCGQHTAEAMKQLVTKGSAAENETVIRI